MDELVEVRRSRRARRWTLSVPWGAPPTLTVPTWLSDPEVDRIIEQYRKENNLKVRSISDAEIVERLIYALVNEGAKILEEGIALRASDIDMVYLTGYGFPPYRGGPMFYADTVGLEKVLDRIETFQKGYMGQVWKPAPLLVRLAKAGKKFNE